LAHACRANGRFGPRGIIREVNIGAQEATHLQSAHSVRIEFNQHWGLMMRRPLTIVVLSLTMVLCLAGKAKSQPVLTAIAVSGDPAPGTEPGISYQSVGGPTTNELNDVVYRATLSDFSEAIYFSAGPTPQLIARGGQQAPGLPTGVEYWNYLGVALLNDNRQIVIRNILQGRDAGVLSHNNEALFAGTMGDLHPIVREGDPALSAEGALYGEFSSPTAFNDAGEFTFNVSLTGPGVDSTNNRALYLGSPDSLQLVARTGSPAPGAGEGVVFDEINGAYLNDSGELVFQGRLAGDGVTFANDDVLYGGFADDLQIIARAGDPAPDVPDGIEWSDFSTGSSPLVVTDDGVLSFVANLQGCANALDCRAIYTGPRGALEVAARGGDPIPGIPGYEYFIARAAIGANDSGDLLFGAAIREGSTTQEAQFVRTPEGLQRLISNGDQAPGLPEGVQLQLVRAGEFNDAGQMAFYADLIGPDITNSNNQAVYFYDPATEQFTLLLQKGMEFDVGGGDLRILQTARLMPALGDDGITIGLANNGNLAIGFTTTVGSLVLASPRVPEPSSSMLLTLACVCLGISRRRGPKNRQDSRLH
jgi:hypothetical protein